MKKPVSHQCKLFVATLLLLAVNLSNIYAQAVPVTIQKDAEGNWTLYRNNEPYYVKGVGGSVELDKAVSIGANSIRTWGIDNAGEILDAAQEKGLTVLLGLWLQHERHGFDYDNAEKVKQQLEFFTAIVEKYKNHPALLAWGVGNEVDLFYTNTNVWYAVNDIAKMIHEKDPNHPTMTVTAGLDTIETRLLLERCPEIDIYGINTYGDLGNVAKQLRTTKWTKPYMITEWGPNGHWEVQKTMWQVPVEQSSSEKASSYKERYTNYIAGDRKMCMGSYVFLWGQKQETTATWYGLFDEKGLSSQAVDELERIWTSKEPVNTAPVLSDVTLNNKHKGDSVLIQPFSTCSAIATAIDANGDKLKYVWEVVYESTDIKAGGDVEAKPAALKGLGIKTKGNTVTFTAPEKEGPYRLYLFIYDGNGHYAYQNIPFYVLPGDGASDKGAGVTFKKQGI